MMQGRLCPDASCPRLTMFTPHRLRPCPFPAKHRGPMVVQEYVSPGRASCMQTIARNGLASSDRVQRQYSLLGLTPAQTVSAPRSAAQLTTSLTQMLLCSTANAQLPHVEGSHPGSSGRLITTRRHQHAYRTCTIPAWWSTAGRR